jgi:hypothetical protein
MTNALEVFTPEQLERDHGYTVVFDLMGIVLCVQCPRCGNATPGFAVRTGDNDRLDGYDHASYMLCPCPENK